MFGRINQTLKNKEILDAKEPDTVEESAKPAHTYKDDENVC